MFLEQDPSISYASVRYQDGSDYTKSFYAKWSVGSKTPGAAAAVKIPMYQSNYYWAIQGSGFIRLYSTTPVTQIQMDLQYLHSTLLTGISYSINGLSLSTSTGTTDEDQVSVYGN